MTIFLVLISLIAVSNAFMGPGSIRKASIRPKHQLKMDANNIVELNSATYAGIAVITMIPSLLLVKFVGDTADVTKDKLSDEQKANFKARMMDTNRGFVNFGVPTSEEEILQKQIAEAYRQDKDVDVAVLEKKLKERAQWRKEMMEESKQLTSDYEDEDGW